MGRTRHKSCGFVSWRLGTDRGWCEQTTRSVNRSLTELNRHTSLKRGMWNLKLETCGVWNVKFGTFVTTNQTGGVRCEQTTRSVNRSLVELNRHVRLSGALGAGTRNVECEIWNLKSVGGWNLEFGIWDSKRGMRNLKLEIWGGVECEIRNLKLVGCGMWNSELAPWDVKFEMQNLWV